MSELLQFGKYLLIDRDGYYTNSCSREHIRPPWKNVIDDTVKAYVEHLNSMLHSVYVRGSVAHGTAVESVSDVDTFAVTQGSLQSHDLRWIESCTAMIESRYPFAVGVELVVFSFADIIGPHSVAEIRFILKVLSVCVHGQDLAQFVPSFGPSQRVILNALRLEESIQEVRQLLSLKAHGSVVSDLCRWIMKCILRSSFELVMDIDGSYTRDLYPCYQTFSKYYPEKKDVMRHVLQLAVNPSSDPQRVLSILDDCGAWLVQEIDQKLRLR